MAELNLVESESGVESEVAGKTPTINFTNKVIDGLPIPQLGRVDYKDTKVTGLYLRVTKNEIKTFSYKGRPKGSTRTERLTIGRYPTVKAEEARAIAKSYGGQQAIGNRVAEASRHLRQEMTLAELFDKYYDHISTTTSDPEGTKSIWELYLKAKWGTRQLSDISANEIDKWHKDLPKLVLKRREEKAAAIKAVREAKEREVAARRLIRKHGPVALIKNEKKSSATERITGKSVANRAIELMRAIYNFALVPKRKYFVGQNPAESFEPYEETERERFIHPDEMHNFLRSLYEEPIEAARDAILIALITGQRRANVLAMRWEDINLDRGEWCIPAEVMKSKKPHVAPLVDLAVQILRTRLESRTSEWVFASPIGADGKPKSKTGHIVDIRAAWKRIRNRAGLQDVVFHDLRRTNASWQIICGGEITIVGKSLAHSSLASTRIYARLTMAPVRHSIQTATHAMFGTTGETKMEDVHYGTKRLAN